MDKPLHEQLEDLKNELNDSFELLAMTPDLMERKVIRKGIALLKQEIREMQAQLFGYSSN